MRHLAGRISARIRTDSGCAVLLCILVLVAHTPGLVLRLSPNPIYWVAGLTKASQPGLTPGYPWLDPNAGYTVQALGSHSAKQWLHGHIPWWNSYTGVGVPLAAEMQPASFFLPFILLLYFPSGVLLLKIVLQIVAGLAAFALLRQLGVSRIAALSGAAIYELSGTFAWYSDSPILPTPFLPLLLFGVERAFANATQKRSGGWLWIAIALAYSILAGFPETAYLNGLLVLAWTLYRLASSPHDARWIFGRKVATGAAVGLAIAAPLILAFFEYQSLSAIRHSGWNHLALPKICLTSFLMPYIFGPLHAFDSADPSRQLDSGLGNCGGYFGLSTLFLSTIAIFSGRRMRGLRVLLAVWIIVFTARSLGAIWAENLVGLIPPLDYVWVFHYSEPTWEMCGAVLAALAIDDWRKGIKRWPVLAGAAVSLAISILALGLSSKLIAELFHNAAHYARWFDGSLLWATLSVAVLAILFCKRASRSTAGILAMVVFVDAGVLFAIPELAGFRTAKLDLGVVTFLREHLGLERMYTLGPFAPNYGAFFHVASINHNAVPIPKEWIRYIRQSLDPAVTPHLFTGFLPPPFSARENALRTHIAGFEATAVKYIVTPPGENPFVSHFVLGRSNGANVPFPLESGERLSGTTPAVPLHRVSSIGVVIGTYGGAATGSLRAKICAGADCSSGTAALAHAGDNERFDIPLRPPLEINNGSSLSYSFMHIGDPAVAEKHAVAIWIWPNSKIAPIHVAGREMSYSPEITLDQIDGSAPPQPVYRGKTADIYELPHPAPYFEAQGGPCVLSPDSRKALRASCKSPATLLRRELYYPGWRAYVNGKREPVHAQSIFESIPLPVGDSRITFAYSPTHIGWGYTGTIVGLLAIGAQAVVDRKKRSQATQITRELAATAD